MFGDTGRMNVEGLAVLCHGDQVHSMFSAWNEDEAAEAASPKDQPSRIAMYSCFHAFTP